MLNWGDVGIMENKMETTMGNVKSQIVESQSAWLLDREMERPGALGRIIVDTRNVKCTKKILFKDHIHGTMANQLQAQVASCDDPHALLHQLATHAGMGNKAC